MEALEEPISVYLQVILALQMLRATQQLTIYILQFHRIHQLKHLHINI